MPNNKINEVKTIFNKISCSYDFLNSLLSLGLHRLWKTKLVEREKLLQPVVLENTVIVMNDQGYISLLDKFNGKILKYEKITGEIDYQIRILKSNKSFF